MKRIFNPTLLLSTLLYFILSPLQADTLEPSSAPTATQAFNVAARIFQNWDSQLDKLHGFPPKSISDPKLQFWNSQDVGADLFGHVLLAGQMLDLPAKERWARMIEMEKSICGPMPCDIDLPSKKMRPQTPWQRMFGATEYAKDGLMPLTEKLGAGPWFDRLKEVADEIMAGASVATPYGPIPAQTAEANGNCLQILTRLWWKTRNEKYLEMAERIGDAYVKDTLMRNSALIPARWDFSAKKPIRPLFILKDHGNELFLGLSELYYLEKKMGRPRGATYAPALKNLFDRTANLMKEPKGLMLDFYDPTTDKRVQQWPNDNWGYLIAAFKTFDLANGNTKYQTFIDKFAAGVVNQLKWDKGYDNLSDSVESMLYVLQFSQPKKVDQWLSTELQDLYSRINSDGWLDKKYLEGNVVRTSLLYGLRLTQGTMIRPWSPKVQWTADFDKKAEVLNINLKSDSAWAGKIHFDTPRHKTFWNFPDDYPRLNAYPEYFTLDESASYEVSIKLKEEKTNVVSGKQLAGGLDLKLAGPTELCVVTIQKKSP